MVKREICLSVLVQLPLIRYSRFGTIIRIQASKYISQEERIDLVFDVFVSELVPAKLTQFFDISANNKGDFVLLTSQSCCVVAKIPWEKSLNKSIKPNSHSEQTGKEFGNPHKIEGFGVKMPSHTYGLFEDELDSFGESLITNSASGNTYGGLGSSLKQQVYEIPVIVGHLVLNTGKRLANSKTISDSSCSIVKSLWYHLDDYTVFILTNSDTANKNDDYMNKSEIITLDLIALANKDYIFNGEDDEVLRDKLGNINEEISEFSSRFRIAHKNSNSVDFVFGRGPDIWNMLTVYVLLDNYRIVSICPVITNRMRLPYFAYETLYSSMVEQEFLSNAEDFLNESSQQFDDCLYKLLKLLLSDLRNPVDESGNIIETVLSLDIPKESFLIISDLLKPVPIELEIKREKIEDTSNNEEADGTGTGGSSKTLKFASVTNFPLSVFLIINSELKIGLFISSYLSLPNFKTTNNPNISQDFSSSNKDPNYHIEKNLALTCLQSCSLSQRSKVSLGGNLHAEAHPLKLYDGTLSNSSKEDDDAHEEESALFVVGVLVNSTFSIVYIDWLHYLFSFYSQFDQENAGLERGNKVVAPISDKIEMIRRHIQENTEVSVSDLLLSSDVDLSLSHLSFRSRYSDQSLGGISENEGGASTLKPKINREIAIAELFYPSKPLLSGKVVKEADAGSTESLAENDKVLVNSMFDQLPEMAGSELLGIKRASKEFSLDKGFIKELAFDKPSRENNVQIEYQLEKLDQISYETLMNNSKCYIERLNNMKNNIKLIENEQDVSKYHLELLKLLNDYNTNVIAKINDSRRPILGMLENIKPRLSLMNELKEDIEATSDLIKKRQEEIDQKIQKTLEVTNQINDQISRVRASMLEELNFQRLQYNQDVILPELLLMLSNVQLELCSCIISISEEKTHTQDEFETTSSYRREFESYLKHNKSVLENFQAIQTKILELSNRITNSSES
ncbi:hypothetical protein HWI79_2972 [Cryptosporidium felis]|nr:hypothetical protein HWI79_2972 [Cryptosporidium felis]